MKALGMTPAALIVVGDEVITFPEVPVRVEAVTESRMGARVFVHLHVGGNRVLTYPEASLVLVAREWPDEH